jgi:hypothetical protein
VEIHLPELHALEPLESGAVAEGRRNGGTDPNLLEFEPHPAAAESPEREPQTIGSAGTLCLEVAMQVQRDAACVQDLMLLAGFGSF